MRSAVDMTAPPKDVHPGRAAAQTPLWTMPPNHE